jgi:hypothetical protein
MKPVLIGVVVLGMATVTAIQAIFIPLKGASMTYQELFSRTVEAFREVPFLEWTPCSIDPDYKYGVCFIREEGQGQNELNQVLPPLLEKRGLTLSGIESGQSTSGGAVYAPGLERYGVRVGINEFDVSLYLGEGVQRVGRDPTRPLLESDYALKSLGDAARDITALLVSARGAVENEVVCEPASDRAYCARTTLTAREVLNNVSERFYFTARNEMQAGYDAGRFYVDEKNQEFGYYYVKIDYQKQKDADVYHVWYADYKRYDFKITYTPALRNDPQSKAVIRVEARWVDGYTPPRTEK